MLVCLTHYVFQVIKLTPHHNGMRQINHKMVKKWHKMVIVVTF